MPPLRQHLVDRAAAQPLGVALAALRVPDDAPRDAGVDAAAYLLDMVALEIDAARRPVEGVMPREGSP